MLKSFVGKPGAEFDVDQIDEAAWTRLADRHVLYPGRSQPARALREASRPRSTAEQAHRHAGNAIFYLAIADQFFGTGGRAARQGRAHRSERGRGRHASRLAPRRDREAVRPQPGLGARAQRPHPAHAARGPDLPDRPFPRQGDGPEHHGVPLRQRPVRADLEPRPHRPRADHRGRDGRRRAARQVLRGDRRAARHGAQPPVPLLSMVGDGAARRASTPLRSAPRRPRSSRRCRTVKPERAVRGQYGAGTVLGQAGDGLSQGAERGARIATPRPMSR